MVRGEIYQMVPIISRRVDKVVARLQLKNLGQRIQGEFWKDAATHFSPPLMGIERTYLQKIASDFNLLVGTFIGQPIIPEVVVALQKTADFIERPMLSQQKAMVEAFGQIDSQPGNQVNQTKRLQQIVDVLRTPFDANVGVSQTRHTDAGLHLEVVAMLNAYGRVVAINAMTTPRGEGTGFTLRILRDEKNEEKAITMETVDTSSIKRMTHYTINEIREIKLDAEQAKPHIYLPDTKVLARCIGEVDSKTAEFFTQAHLSEVSDKRSVKLNLNLHNDYEKSDVVVATAEELFVGVYPVYHLLPFHAILMRIDMTNKMKWSMGSKNLDAIENALSSF